MRHFKYNEQGVDEPITISENEIRKQFYPYYVDMMRKVGKEDQISWEGCLDEWIVVNWAWPVEVDDDTHID